jgi:hypothetical protein
MTSAGLRSLAFFKNAAMCSQLRDFDTISTTLLSGKITLLQPKVGFHASKDSILLAAAAPRFQTPCRILDVGCGFFSNFYLIIMICFEK